MFICTIALGLSKVTINTFKLFIVFSFLITSCIFSKVNYPLSLRFVRNCTYKERMGEKNSKETGSYKLYLVLRTIVDLNITQLKKRCILTSNKNRKDVI